MPDPADRTDSDRGTETHGGDTGGSGASPPASWVDTVIKLGTFVLAFLALLALALFIRFLLANVTATEDAWQRYVYLLTGIEAIAFAAAGYLFGREVNRGAVQQAEKRAETAEDTAGKTARRADDTEQRRKSLEDESKHASSLAAAQGARLNDLKATVNGMYSSYPTRGDGVAGVTIAPEDGDDEPNGGARTYRLKGSDFDEFVAIRGGTHALSILQERETERSGLETEIRRLKAILDQPLLPEELKR